MACSLNAHGPRAVRRGARAGTAVHRATPRGPRPHPRAGSKPEPLPHGRSLSELLDGAPFLLPRPGCSDRPGPVTRHLLVLTFYGSGIRSTSLPVCDPCVWSSEPRQLSAWFRLGSRMSSSRGSCAGCGPGALLWPDSVACSGSEGFLVSTIQGTWTFAGMQPTSACGNAGEADQLTNGVGERVDAKRLDQVLVRPRDLGLGPVDRALQRGDHDHRHVSQARCGADLLAEREAAGVRQPEVEADHVRDCAVEHGGGFGSGRGLVDAQAQPPKTGRDQAAGVRVVLDHQRFL